MSEVQQNGKEPSALKALLAIGPDALQPWLGAGIAGLGGGAGIILGRAAIQTLRDHPEFLPVLTGDKVLIFAGVIIFLLIFDRRMDRFSQLHAKSVAAQEMLAANVGALVEKDDRRQVRMDLLLGEMARTSENNEQSLKRIEEWIDGERKKNS